MDQAHRFLVRTTAGTRDSSHPNTEVRRSSSAYPLRHGARNFLTDGSMPIQDLFWNLGTDEFPVKFGHESPEPTIQLEIPTGRVEEIAPPFLGEGETLGLELKNGGVVLKPGAFEINTDWHWSIEEFLEGPE